MSADDSLASARVLFEPDLLTELVGRPVRARRLRHKPGLSTVASLESPDGPWGWIQVAAPHHAAKLHNALRRARRRGMAIRVREVPGTTLITASGELAADPRLVRAFEDLPVDMAERVLTRPGAVLRHNPLRRLIARDRLPDRGEVVIRMTAERCRRDDSGIVRLAKRGVPVVPRTHGDGVPHTTRVGLWPFVGTTDLASAAWVQRAKGAREAGKALRRLHGQLGSLDDVPAGPDVAAHLAELAHDLRHLDRVLGTRAQDLLRRVADRLPADGEAVLAHGDFSADQVAVDGDHVWLLDLDRMAVAPQLADLGQFHAVELLSREPGRTVTADLLDGYGQVEMADIAPWVGVGLAAKLMEPFREGEPDWIEQISTRMDQLEEWV